MWIIPESDGLDAIASVSGGINYEWDQTDVWVDPLTKWFYVYGDSGCSCNGPYKSLQELLASISDMDLIEQVLAWEWRNR